MTVLHTLFSFSSRRSSLPTEDWLTEARLMQQTLDRSLQKLLSSSDSELQQRVQQLRRTQIEHEVQRAMGKSTTCRYLSDTQQASQTTTPYPSCHSAAHSSEKILAVFRERAAQSSSRDVEAGERLRKIKDELTMNLSTDNHTTLV